jgi:serine/threonine-protein kinase
MGSVFLAKDPSLDRHVAIKVLAPHLLTDEHMLARFKNEARIVAALRNPGIVAIHKFRHVDDLHYFVMDYIEGVPLRSVIRAHGPLPPEGS